MGRFFREINYHLNNYLTPVLKWFLVANVIIFLLQFTILVIFGISERFIMFFAESPYYVIFRGQIWRMITYVFIHANGMHILFNMLALWFFAPELEIRWGSKKFATFFAVTGAGAALIHTIVVLIQALIKTGGESPLFELMLRQPIIGASGIVYGVLIANLIYYPDRMILFNFLLPMKMKYFVWILIVLEFLSTVGSAHGVMGMQDNISHITHLGGALVAFIFIKFPDIFWKRRYNKMYRDFDKY